MSRTEYSNPRDAYLAISEKSPYSVSLYKGKQLLITISKYRIWEDNGIYWIKGTDMITRDHRLCSNELEKMEAHNLADFEEYDF